MTIGEIGTNFVVTAHQDETVVEAARRMRDQHVGALVVADADGRPVGMLTDRDVVVSAVAQSPDRLESLLVGDVMSEPAATVQATDSLDHALKTMRMRGIRRLPVLSQDGRLVSVVSLDDIIGLMAGELHDLVSVVAQEQRRELLARR